MVCQSRRQQHGASKALKVPQLFLIKPVPVAVVFGLFAAIKQKKRIHT